MCALQVVARSDRGTVAAVERTDHPFFMGVDYHAEYTTRRALRPASRLLCPLSARPPTGQAAPRVGIKARVCPVTCCGAHAQRQKKLEKKN